jgi:GH18 family chitinase
MSCPYLDRQSNNSSLTHYLNSHILYAFANVRPDSGEVYLSDLWSDQDIHYPGDSWNDVGTNLYGNLKAIYNLKKENRHLKVLLSIGGWTYSPSFHPVVVNPALRAKFVESSVKLLEDYGLDGLDVDYEYPSDDFQAIGYVALLKELRAALDKHAEKKGHHCKFLLSVSVALTIRVNDECLIFALDRCSMWSRQLQETPCCRHGYIPRFLESNGLRLL